MSDQDDDADREAKAKKIAARAEVRRARAEDRLRDLLRETELHAGGDDAWLATLEAAVVAAAAAAEQVLAARGTYLTRSGTLEDRRQHAVQVAREVLKIRACQGVKAAAAALADRIVLLDRGLHGYHAPSVIGTARTEATETALRAGW